MHIIMNHNKSIFLVGIFFVVVIIFSAVFWQMFNRDNDEAFNKIKKEAEVGSSKEQAVLPAGKNSAVAGTSAGATTKAEANAPESAQNSTPEDMQKPLDSEAEKTKNETADWNTYANEKNKFEFKYPTDASVVANEGLIRISQNKKTWKLREFSNKDKLDLQAWYSDEFSEKERKNCTLSESATLKVGSYETKYVNPNSGNTECTKAGYFSISSDKKNVIRLEIGDETVENVNKILVTFKFLTE